MRARQKVTRAGIELIAAFEGLRRRAARLPDGRWTIGYGHTLSAREGAEVSEADAQALLHFDLLPIAEAVNSLVYTPLTQNQFDALTAFAFNVGVDQFRASDVLKRVNEGRLTEAACALDLWRKADLNGDPVILDALIRRRASEKALFLTPHDGYVPTPSPLVRPTVDTALAPALPQTRPAEIEVPMDGAVAEVHRVAAPEPIASPEPVELSVSDAEPPESLPQPSEPVEAAYSDEIPVETPEELEVQALETSEPGAEAIDPEPVAGFPEPTPVEPVEPAVELEPEPGFPATETEPAETLAAANAAAERIYAPDPPEPADEPEPVAPVVEGGWTRGPGELAVDTPTVTTGSTAPASVWSLTPPPEVIETPPSRVDLAPDGIAHSDEDDETPMFEVVTDTDQDVAQRIVRYEDTEEGDSLSDRGSSGPFYLLFVIGLAAFGGALAAFLKARAGVDGMSNPTVLAWTLALIGAACVGTAVYFLLKRLGGVED